MRRNGKFIVLCIDGGGVRGIIPAIVLSRLEEKLRQIGKEKPLCSYFSTISGTSTGGIIALGLTAKDIRNPTIPACSSADLVQLYSERASEIFSTTIFQDARSLIDATYDEKGIEKILDDVLGDSRYEDTLGTFLVTAYEIEQRRPKVFTNFRSKSRRNYFLKNLARATSAAPTYFDPAKIERLHEPDTFEPLIDGGVFAADPTMVTLSFLLENGVKLEDIVILSLGAGVETRSFFYNEVKRWGNLSWVSPRNGVPIVSILMQSQTEISARFCDVLLNGSGSGIESRRYFRIDGQLVRDRGSDDLDDASPQNLSELKLLARDMLNLKDNDAMLDHIASLL